MMERQKKKVIRNLILWLVALIALACLVLPPAGNRIWSSMRETGRTL